MWYVIGLFEPSVERRKRGSHVKSRWCAISGPHASRGSGFTMSQSAQQLAETLAKQAGFALETVINVNEQQLLTYHIEPFPWLLVQQRYWGKDGL